MRRLAGVFLGSGLFIIVLVFGLALSTLSEHDVLASPLPDTADSCLFCHEGVHMTWQMVTAAPPENLPDTLLPTPDYASGDQQLCSDCHGIDNQFELPSQSIRLQIENVQTRVTNLQVMLDGLFLRHPEWDRHAPRQEKTQTQITAERVNTLIAVVQADGSWGFHDPDYTQGILAEAERLLVLLLEENSD